MKNIFTEHPHSVNETYGQHFCAAFKFGAQMMIGGVACVLHAIFPFIFQQTGSNYLFKIMQEFIARRQTAEDRMVTLMRDIEKKMH